MSQHAHKAAEILLDIKAVSLSPQKPYKYDSGILSPIYTDCRLLISHPKERREIRDMYIEMMKETKTQFDVIAGTATAGIPHAAWIADRLELPMVYVRGKQKDHGKGNRIEGATKEGQTAAVIEDIISTGSSSRETVLALREVGLKSFYIFAIMQYGMQKAHDNFQEAGVTLVAMTDFKTVVEIAAKRKYIQDSEIQTVLDWANDPANWGQKMGFA